ncbi:hypothetical protein MRB53_037915 [Persea americana]|nr:hypothetical protein MRB53_037915 [Persea americana]
MVAFGTTCLKRLTVPSDTSNSCMRRVMMSSIYIDVSTRVEQIQRRKRTVLLPVPEEAWHIAEPCVLPAIVRDAVEGTGTGFMPQPKVGCWDARNEEKRSPVDFED